MSLIFIIFLHLSKPLEVYIKYVFGVITKHRLSSTFTLCANISFLNHCAQKGLCNLVVSGPLPAKVINVASIQETSAIIQWSKPDSGSLSGYTLTLYQETTEQIISNETFVSNQTRKEVTNLIGGTMYLIDLYTTVPGQISDPVKSTFYTSKIYYLFHWTNKHSVLNNDTGRL